MIDSRRSRALAWSVLLALGAALAIVGGWLLLTTFKPYDDEGYVLLSLRHFSQHGALYDLVYSQYGPFPYLLYDALHRLFGFEFTHIAGRGIALVNWLGTAVACACLVQRLTGRIALSVMTLGLTFTYLWIMINEPSHPGGLVSLLVALATWSGAELWLAGRTRRFAVIIALFGATLTLTKINVGVFFLGALAAWLGIHATNTTASRRFTWLSVAAVPLFAFLLMRDLWSADWVRLYAVVFACAAVPCLLTAQRFARPIVNFATWGWAALAGAAATLVLCAGILLRGTSFAGLVDGLLLGPMRHPGVYSHPLDWPTGTAALALISFLAAAGIAWTQRWTDPRVREAIAWLRVLTAAVFLCTPLQWIPTGIATWGMAYGLSLAWLFAVPLTDSRSSVANRWVALVFVLQSLHAYPVAGSQMHWGSFLWVPLLALGLHDAAPLLKTRCAVFTRWLTPLACAAALAPALFATGKLGIIGWRSYQLHPALGLPGAESLRLSPETASDLHIVTQNSAAHADVLFSLPGIFSTNLWSGRPTPTLANTTLWFSLLSSPQQAAIIDRLASAERPVVLVQRDLTAHLIRQNIPIGGPLVGWLQANFQAALKLGSYEIWVRRGRTIAPLGTARVEEPDATSSSTVLTFFVETPAAPISRIDLCDVARPNSPWMTLDAQNASIQIAACDLSGQPTEATRPLDFPFTPPPLAMIRLETQAAGSVDWSRALLILRDEHGASIAQARVLR